MIDTVIDAPDGVLQAIQGVLRGLLDNRVVDALLVPMALPGGSVAPMLVGDPAALDRADPLAPVLPINAARAASLLTLTGHREKLGVVLRSCEIRALVELVKFQQAKLDDVLIVGIDCLGTYKVTDWQNAKADLAPAPGRGGDGRAQAVGWAAVPRGLPDLRAAAAGRRARGADHRAGRRRAGQAVPEGP